MDTFIHHLNFIVFDAPISLQVINHIGDVMISVLALMLFDTWSGQANDNKIGISCCMPHYKE